MYEYIKGIYKGVSRDYIIVENNGMGYKINTSGSTIAKTPKIGENILLYLQQIVREDFIGLYGFLTKEEINMFNLLLTINGIGAKAALSLLSISSVANLKYSIISGDEKNLVRAPGIGKKTAQRIILELKDKMSPEEIENYKDGNREFDAVKTTSEVVEALKALGYSEKEANSALKTIDNSNSIEAMIKEALKFLMN
ncbi:Holliday junction branch migration protein RuvA [Clostridium luticellarii]|uniref:Holliday junction branch migration complex subunit RuvA n=1 Tax=Clostridium luticellarii TaxID=1691940 RepID=A0A2T0BLK9_9CLOT|nr:Holliday junction branch migration protein RuvA [Clostridium luticellarii]MCI1944300.1 Holliday junction branch migration protein RuvA [Clostridium luticellarii]MCI1967796.1 Holliday junction branch migration protein RuvA [Clostridium luticellarii]MCI1994674.1 Holliday junction branch migration protein RuvA [Clostridium luticellarii]MCI2038829.1 Holliday junction branch migration protein RuvA [Clostridium luticellarii]PRR84776.1 Holliday junction ATP-dependent DNA helicase RuvA [Clostridium